MDSISLKKSVQRAWMAAWAVMLPLSAAATPPKIFTPADIQAIANSPSAWASLKGRCDANLNAVINDCYRGQCYAGFGYRMAIEDYGMCYQVAKINAPGSAQAYARKALALMKAISRDDPYFAPNTAGFLALANGTARVFTLPMTPLAGTGVRVFTADTTERSFTYTGATASLGKWAPVVRVSDSAGGPARYVNGVDYRFVYNDGVFLGLRWLGAAHPANGAAYHVTQAGDSFTQVPAGNVSVSGNTLTLSAAPAAGRAVFIEMIGADYQQTGNGFGGPWAVMHDGPGYPMRTLSVGLAEGYDLLRDSPDFTPSMRAEFSGVLNQMVDVYKERAYERDGPALGNYYIRGYLTGTLYSAYATDDENPRAAEMKALADTLLRATFNQVRDDLPGGYGPQGTYTNGVTVDILGTMSLWKSLTGEDLLSQLEWTDTHVPATIHGTKPDRATFYDGGDWNDLPALPLESAMASFVGTLPGHPMTPYARQLLSDMGKPAGGPLSDYKASFPLSYRGKVTGPLYARSDWGTGAVWLSLTAGPIVMDHQHQDQGHFTLQRGADYLVNDSGRYGARDSLPHHNTLGFDDRGAGNLVVYSNPPSQGLWGNKAKITKYAEQNTFVYGQADITDAYVNNDGVRNAVKRAVRTLVFIRPDVVVVHDQAQSANAATKKYFSVNFNSHSVARSGSIFSSVTGASKVFMRSLVPANPSPSFISRGTSVGDNHGGSYPVDAVNYQVMAAGQTVDSFLHLFHLTPSGQSAMAGSAHVQSSDGRAQGVEVDMGSRRWLVMSASSAALLTGGTLSYATNNALNTGPAACPCTHVVGDLPPSVTYQIALQGAGGTISAGTDANGVLTFSTDNPGTTGVQILLSGGAADTRPPAKPQGFRRR